MPADAMHAATPGRTLSLRRSRTVDSILMAAMIIVAQDGAAALSMSAVAARAGVSRQTLYGYFPDVDAILAGLVVMGDAGTDALAGRMESKRDPRAALTVLVSAAVESVAAGHPPRSAIAAAMPADLRADMQAHEERAERLVVDLLLRAQRDRLVRTDLDPEIDGRILYRAAFAGAELAGRQDIDTGWLTQRLTADLWRIIAPEQELPGRP